MFGQMGGKSTVGRQPEMNLARKDVRGISSVSTLKNGDADYK